MDDGMSEMIQEPEKLDLASHDVTEERREELLRLFPEARTEGGKIDFDRLRRALGEIVDPGRERYGLTWPGKGDCFRTIQAPSVGTLRADRDESVDFDKTENLIIEGDNLEVLKLLQKSYLGKVKMIYIDPPYNTGNDFIYPDDYSESLQTYLEYTGQVDSEGRKFGTNTEAEGRFHSKWLNMMYPRLHLARNLLSDSGVIFISINDMEATNLRRACDEIFGEDCFVAQFVWNNEGNIDNQSKVKVAHEYILCYSRRPDGFERPATIDPNIEEDSKLYNDTIENSITKNGPANPPSRVLLPRGFPASHDDFVVETREAKWPKVLDRIVVKESRLAEPALLESGWSSRNLLDLFISNGCVPIQDSEGKKTWFAITPTGAIYGYKKRADDQGHVLSVIRNVGTTKQNSSMLRKFGIEFSYPKPVRLLQYLVEISTAHEPEALILDFFPGSGTLGQAVQRANAKDGGTRRYILVQLPEKLEPDDPNTTNGMHSIFDLCVHRMRSVQRILATERQPGFNFDNKTNADLGFRVYRLSESSFQLWRAERPDSEASLAEQLELHVAHIRQGRSAEDLLYEILLKSGYPLTESVEKIGLAGKTVYSVAGGNLFVCLERELTLELVRAMAERKPVRVVCLDEGFAGHDQLKVNAVQIFKTKGVTSFKTV